MSASRIGVLGTGVVGATLGSRLVELGHDVTMGSRATGNARALEWVAAVGRGASQGSFADAAESAAIVINATHGMASVAAVTAAGAANLSGKVLIDVSNPLDFSNGFPPRLSVVNDDSLAEQIQRAVPEARVVKTLNTMNCDVMVNPAMIPGVHNVFLSGDDQDAKSTTAELLREFGWRDDGIVDLGDITTARGPEMFLALWIRMVRAMPSPRFNLRLVTEVP